MSVVDTIKQTLNTTATQAFGLTMPRVNRKWVDSATTPITAAQIIYTRADMSLTLNGTGWLAPLGGTLRQLASSVYPLGVNLLAPDGSAVTSGSVLELKPQSYFRLSRLYANTLEAGTQHNPRRAAGESVRPVPCYFHFSTAVAGGEGVLEPGDPLSVDGTLRIYDERGYPIDPLAVASALLALTAKYGALVADDPAADQLTDIVALDSNTTFNTRLVTVDGQPYGGAHLMGSLTVIDGAATDVGLFGIGVSGTSTTVARQVKKDDATDTNGAFPPLKERQFLLAPASYGRMRDEVNVPAIPNGVTLQHDFLTVEVDLLETRLLGTANPDFTATKLEPRPKLRLHDHVQLLGSGNAVMGGIGLTMAGTRDASLLVGETITNDFNLPADTTGVNWPIWPALPASLTADTPDSLASGLKEQWLGASTAAIIDNADQPINVDVLLTLKGLPLGSAVRVFHRKLGRDFVEERGAGAGAVVVSQEAGLTYTSASGSTVDATFTGTVQLHLEDPLGLVSPTGTTAPTNPILNVDIAVVTQNGVSRIFGNVEFPIDTTAVANPITPVDNGLLTNFADRGVAHSGLIGLPSTPVDLSSSDLITAALTLMGEAGDLGRDAPRLPLMRRRSLIAAVRTGTAWRGTLSAGSLTGDLHGADSRAGSPGSPGGRNLRITGAFTQNGRLAYDMARAAFRRTESFYTRVPALADGNWNEPAEPTALGINAVQTANAGPFAGAVLHTVSPKAETPELALFESLVTTHAASIPTDLDGLINWLEQRLSQISVGTPGGTIDTQIDRLRDGLITWVKQQLQDNSLDETTTERLHSELIRELSAACYGRRDSLWALESALKTAREFIYLETPALAPIDYGSGDTDYTRDLLKMIKTRMGEVPALKLIICTPKTPFYDAKYGEFKRRELYERFRLFVPTDDGNGGTTTPVLQDDRTVIFHPMGFPGRPAGIGSQTVIIDDNWILTGATTFRRRGLTFDEGHDLVLTGLDRRGGRVPQITAHRVALLGEHLNLARSNKTTLAGSNFARLRDGRSAFTVIREILRADGYGLIERLHSGIDPHVAYTEPALTGDVYNPEGQTYNSLLGSLVAWLTSVGTGTPGVFHDV